MAENDPTAGPPGSPEGAQPVATAPVAAPGAGGAVPPAGPPARPRGLLRWGVALLALAVMVGVVSVAAALLAGNTTASAVQGWLPRETVAYLELRADLPGDQRAKVGDLLARFPGFADQSSLDAKIDEALERLLEGSGVSWTSEIKPWLGGEIGLAVTAAVFDGAAMGSLGAGGMDNPDLAKPPADGMALLVAVKDADAAQAWVAKQVGGTQSTETYAGGEITLIADAEAGSMAFAVRGNVLVLGPTTTVKAALDTGGASPVRESAAFAAARATAPAAYLGYGYIDMARFVDVARAAAGDDEELPAACLDAVVAMVPAWTAGSVRAMDDAIVFEATSPVAGDGASTAKASASAIAARLPSTTIAAIEVRELGAVFVSGLETLKTQLACDPSTTEALAELDQALATVGGAETIIGWAGDAAIAVEYAGGSLGGGLAATVTDEAAAERMLAQVRVLLTLGGSGVGVTARTEAYGSGELLVVELPAEVEVGAGEFPTLAATVQDGVFALGTIDFVKHVVDTGAGDSLASSDVYRRAISAAGGDGVSDVFVDLGAFRIAAEAMIPADERSRYETEVKPFLEPFEAFASVAEAPGATVSSRAVITFTN